MTGSLEGRQEPSDSGRQERYRELARQFAMRTSGIMGSINGGSPTEMIFWTKDSCLIDIRKGGYKSIGKNVDNIGGVGGDISYGDGDSGKRIMYLQQDSREKPTGFHLEVPLGVKASYELYVGIHTDVITLSNAKEFLDKHPEQTHLIGTYFYFDEEGNYGKAVLLPRYIEDNRPTLRTFEKDSSDRFVQSEMKPGDFELVDFALGVLEEGVKDMQIEK